TSTMTVIVSGGSGTISYQWQSSSDGSSGWANATGTGSTTATYTPPKTIPGTTYYRVIVHATENGCEDLISAVVSVTVSGDIQITGLSNGGFIFDGGTWNLSVSARGA